ncbi:DUF6801 domain-containing protein [Saccharopolyspora taberi]|uniref:DUF6801 domain-containing protein n=1 Tax=Saccharopolyspora taberi TaxID=60895 RepID=A0ABN3VHU1_9PSEU
MNATTIPLTRRTTGILGVLVAALMLFGAGVAGAADKTLTWKGDFPAIGEQTVKTVVRTEIPQKASPGQTLTVPFTLDVDAGEAAAQGLRLVGATKLSGTIHSSVTLTGSDGRTVPVAVELPIPETPVPPEGTLTFSAKGSVEVTVPADAAPGQATSAADPNATTHVETDAPELGKFDVQLTLSPPDQDTVLGTTQIG